MVKRDIAPAERPLARRFWVELRDAVRDPALAPQLPAVACPTGRVPGHRCACLWTRPRLALAAGRLRAGELRAGQGGRVRPMEGVHRSGRSLRLVLLPASP